MAPTREERPAERAWGWLALAAVVALALAQSGELRALARDAEAAAAAIRSDADFLRSPAGLADEYAVFEALRAQRPRGAPVSLPGDTQLSAEVKRFWLPLLPRYPVASDASLVICAKPCGSPDDRVLAGGRRFVLLERRDATRDAP